MKGYELLLHNNSALILIISPTFNPLSVILSQVNIGSFTEIFRKENGEWKLMHRHADKLAE